jgi:hypothetical protein
MALTGKTKAGGAAAVAGGLRNVGTADLGEARGECVTEDCN